MGPMCWDVYGREKQLKGVSERESYSWGVAISRHISFGPSYRLFLHRTCSRRYPASISFAVNVGDDGQADAIGSD